MTGKLFKSFEIFPFLKDLDLSRDFGNCWSLVGAIE